MNPVRRNKTMALALVGVIAGMAGLVVASVPLYRLFCQVTGYGGTVQTRTAGGSENKVIDRVIRIRFNADKSADLPWSFQPVQREMTVRVGETGLAFFHAANLSSSRVVGSAIYNVTPQKVGLYFTKTACFCFTEQALEPGEEADMAVSFYIDPEIMDDPNLDDVTTITLSYSFFRKSGGTAQGDPVSSDHIATAALAGNTQ